MKALITNAVMTLLDDQIVNAAEKSVIDEVYALSRVATCFCRMV